MKLEALLVLVPLIVRHLLFFKKTENVSFPMQSLAWFYGLGQDLFVAQEIFCAGWLFSLILPETLSYITFLLLIALMQGYVLFDFFLASKAHTRMTLSYFSFLPNISSFFDSLVHKGLRSFLITWLFTSVATLAAFSLSHETSISWGWKGAFAIYGLLGLIGNLYLPKKISLWTHNACLQLQYELVTRYMIKRRAKQVTFDKLPSDLIPPCEHFERVSDAYPLLKNTAGFFGTKTFEINIEENEKPHVVLILLESFRAADIGCMGAAKSLTPHFDKLASEGILFDQFYSNGTLTNQAMLASLFGVFPFFAGANKMFLNNHPQSVKGLLDASLIGIHEFFKKSSYHTAYIDPTTLYFDKCEQFLKKQGFETVIGKEEFQKIFPPSAFSSWGLHDEHLFPFALEWIETHEKDHPLFLTLFTISNHHPWTLPSDTSGIKRKDSAHFAETMRYTDECLHAFIQNMAEKGLDKKTIFFILGDHGQSFEEERLFTEELHENQVRIPFLILARDRIKAPEVISELASQVDIFPTLMDLMQFTGLNHSMGRSLMRSSTKPSVFFNSYVFDSTLGCREENLKYISSKDQEFLFDLSTDPKETTNLIHKNPKKGQELKEKTEQKYDFLGKIFQTGRFHFSSDLYEYPDYLASPTLTDEELKKQLKNAKNLKNLTLSHCSHLSEIGFDHVARYGSSLESLALAHCLIKDSSLQRILKNCSNLKYLDIEDCLLLTEKGIEHLFEQGKQLERLSLKGLSEITDKAFISLKEKDSSLKRLNIASCDQISDRGLKQIALAMPQLERLDLSCKQITEEGLFFLKDHCPSLELLLLRDLPHIPESSLEDLKSGSLKILF